MVVPGVLDLAGGAREMGFVQTREEEASEWLNIGLPIPTRTSLRRWHELLL